TRQFYGDVLGFSVDIYATDNYLIARKGEIEVHFWLTDNEELCRNTSIYVRGGGVDRLYAEFAASDVPDLGAYELKPWGMKEFHLLDPHGNLLRFGRIPPEESGAGKAVPEDAGKVD
ncbi:MAG: VOC family protein, partial [Marinomonas sp.]